MKNSDFKKEAFDLISNTGKDKIEANDKAQIEVQDLMLELKKNLASYLNSLIGSATQEDQLQKLIQSKLISLIPDLNFDQLMKLLSNLDKKKSVINDQLTTLLKPTQQANSPLLEALSGVKEEEKNKFDKAYDEMSSEELRDMDKFDRLMSIIENAANKAEKDEKNTME